MYYVHIICIMCTLCAQYQCHPYIISSTLYIFYYVQLSLSTLSTQMHIVHVICMWPTHVHIICLSSLTLLGYPIIHNLVSAKVASVDKADHASRIAVRICRQKDECATRYNTKFYYVTSMELSQNSCISIYIYVGNNENSHNCNRKASGRLALFLLQIYIYCCLI